MKAQCYLLHFDKPVGNPQTDAQRAANGLPPRKRPFTHGARHYLGYTEHLDKRIEHHRNGTGANLTKVAGASGCEIIVARVWDNATRATERKLKTSKHHSRLCPLCNPHAARSGKLEA